MFDAVVTRTGAALICQTARIAVTVVAFDLFLPRHESPLLRFRFSN